MAVRDRKRAGGERPTVGSGPNDIDGRKSASIAGIDPVACQLRERLQIAGHRPPHQR
jgi:hypothetical protein